MTKRIQRKRTRGWKMPPNTVYVGRPTKWGNPYKVGESYSDDVYSGGKLVLIRSWENITPEQAVEFFGEAIANHYPAVKLSVEEIRKELRGKDLACWCPLDQPCHADVLLKLANGKETK